MGVVIDLRMGRGGGVGIEEWEERKRFACLMHSEGVGDGLVYRLDIGGCRSKAVS